MRARFPPKPVEFISQITAFVFLFSSFFFLSWRNSNKFNSLVDISNIALRGEEATLPFVFPLRIFAQSGLQNVRHLLSRYRSLLLSSHDRLEPGSVSFPVPRCIAIPRHDVMYLCVFVKQFNRFRGNREKGLCSADILTSRSRQSLFLFQKRKREREEGIREMCSFFLSQFFIRFVGFTCETLPRVTAMPAAGLARQI